MQPRPCQPPARTRIRHLPGTGIVGTPESSSRVRSRASRVAVRHDGAPVSVLRCLALLGVARFVVALLCLAACGSRVWPATPLHRVAVPVARAGLPVHPSARLPRRVPVIPGVGCPKATDPKCPGRRKYSTETPQRPVTAASLPDRQHTELAGTTAKRPSSAASSGQRG